MVDSSLWILLVKLVSCYKDAKIITLVQQLLLAAMDNLVHVYTILSMCDMRTYSWRTVACVYPGRCRMAELQKWHAEWNGPSRLPYLLMAEVYHRAITSTCAPLLYTTCSLCDAIPHGQANRPPHVYCATPMIICNC